MMRPTYLRSLGLSYYSTKLPGIGGKIRQTLRDFIVEEISLDNKISYCFKENSRIKLNQPTHYLRLSLEKHGVETLRAIQLLANSLKISISNIGFSGMKDKEAITSQFISIKDADINIVKNIKIENIFLRNFQYIKSALNIGSLFGNHFIITIRDIELSTEEIEGVIDSIIIEIKKGLINYFGLQRFGKIRPITHLVGKALLRRNYENAVKIYLTEIFPDERNDAINARTELKETWDFEKAIKNLPSRLNYEIMMVKSLIKYPNDYKKALEALPKRLQSMIIYAYQSHIFNKILSKRKEQKAAFSELRINDFVLILDNQELTTHAVVLASEKNFSHLKHLIEINKAVIAAPLIGSQTQIKEDYIKEILKEEGLQLKDFQSKILHFDRKGGFRPILFSPLNFKIKKIGKDEINPTKNKVIIDFSLKRGSYATVLLDEIIKNKKLEK
ncbi:MAG: tRNA pseudouridine(13) synthase TruD [Candidatus Helarchaeota archaeon]|nr:tRNA pseudouridine(13) synthase TruD [Candidatus Helarchaeota archaeon]